MFFISSEITAVAKLMELIVAASSWGGNLAHANESHGLGWRGDDQTTGVIVSLWGKGRAGTNTAF